MFPTSPLFLFLDKLAHLAPLRHPSVLLVHGRLISTESRYFINVYGECVSSFALIFRFSRDYYQPNRDFISY